MGSATPSPFSYFPIDRWRWRIVWLLFLATMLNYMDRQALNQTSSYLIAEFQIPFAEQETTYGRIEFAFGISFALFQVFAGFLADRFSLRWLYVMAILVWSTAGCLTGLIPAGALWALMACRALLGFGEAFNWPCAVSTVRRVVPRESRGLANGIFHSGASVGAVATPLMVLAIVGTYFAPGISALAGAPAGWMVLPPGEWRTVFLIIGAGGLIWSVLWLLATRGEAGRVVDSPPAADPDVAPVADLPLSRVFALRTFWVMLAVGCAVNLTWHFFRIWFVRYLKKDLERPPEEQQWLPLGFFIAADLGSMASGYAIRRLTRTGYSVERSRKLVMTGLAIVCLGAIPATQVGPLWAKMVLFYAVAAGAMGGFAVFFALAQDIVGRHTAQLLGIAGSTAWFLIAGLNLLVGEAADKSQTFVPLIIAASFIPVVAASANWLWPEPRSTNPPV